jgi:hypothetical protein
MRQGLRIGENDHMSNLSSLRTQSQPGLPTPPRGDTIAQYATYLEAQRAVDYLSDNHFPVQAVTIVGVDLQMVERVTGRLTYSRVALAGLLSGAWFGLFVGLLISLFGSAEGFSVFAAILIGAAFGGLFGLISYAFTGGRRDFTSTSQIVAGEYRVLCLTEQAGAARQLLNKLADEGGPRSQPARPEAMVSPAQPYQQPYPGQYGGPGNPGNQFPPSVQPGPGQPGQPNQPGQWGQPWGTPQQPGQFPPPGQPQPGQPQPPQPPVSGPTYGEMLDRKKAEEREAAARETAERDRRAQAAQTERDVAAQRAREQAEATQALPLEEDQERRDQ